MVVHFHADRLIHCGIQVWPSLPTIQLWYIWQVIKTEHSALEANTGNAVTVVIQSPGILFHCTLEFCWIVSTGWHKCLCKNSCKVSNARCLRFVVGLYRYEFLYRQAVGTEDAYLGSNDKDPSSTCCEVQHSRVLLGLASLLDTTRPDLWEVWGFANFWFHESTNIGMPSSVIRVCIFE